ncbi:MAG: hypothetical protein GX267_16120 [Fibrobacter sp.]|jgi:hypothetical protein|nr:hypothetical protein [Fibrobacter sp.]
MADQINKFDYPVLHRFSWCDVVIISIILIGIFLTIPAIRSLSPQTVLVFEDNRIIAEYPVDQNRIFDVKGKIGIMKVKVQNRSVSVCSSPCPHQLCIRQGHISKTTSQIVCIPNHILITIDAKKGDMLDAIAR